MKFIVLNWNSNQPINYSIRKQRERDAREVRQLNREIRAQERHYQAESKKHKEAAETVSQVHTQFGQHYKGSSSERTSSASTPPSKSPRDSVERNILPPSSSERFSDQLLSSSSQTTSESLKQDKSSSSRKVNSISLYSVSIFNSKIHLIVNFKDHTSTTTSPQTVTGTPPAYHQQTVAGPPIPFAAVATLATVAPILPLGVTTLRDDSTESDQSLTYSHSQQDALHRFMWVTLIYYLFNC